MDFAVGTDNRVKAKRSTKKREQLRNFPEINKKLWNVRVTVISQEVGALGMVLKVFEKIIVTTKQKKNQDHAAMLRISRILR